MFYVGNEGPDQTAHKQTTKAHIRLRILAYAQSDLGLRYPHII